MVSAKPAAATGTKGPHRCAPVAINAISSKYSEESRDYLSLKLAAPTFSARIQPINWMDVWRKIISAALRL